MDVLNLLHREEKKLAAAKDKIAGRLVGIRVAINALQPKAHRQAVSRIAIVSGKPHKLAGRKLSAKHRAAIKAGWAARKKSLTA